MQILPRHVILHLWGSLKGRPNVVTINERFGPNRCIADVDPKLFLKLFDRSDHAQTRFWHLRQHDYYECAIRCCILLLKKILERHLYPEPASLISAWCFLRDNSHTGIFQNARYKSVTINA